MKFFSSIRHWALGGLPSVAASRRRVGCPAVAKAMAGASAFALCLIGCASYRIPTPCGEARLNTFCKTVEIPKITVVASNATMTVEGYASKGDAETITASAGALGAFVGAAANAAATVK